MHTRIPFRRALDRETSDKVAVRHYEWIKRTLAAANVPASVYNIALAWNAGVTAVIKGRAPAIAHAYARRASTLAATYAARAAASQEARLVAAANAPDPFVVTPAPSAPKPADTLLVVRINDEPEVVLAPRITAAGGSRLLMSDVAAVLQSSTRVTAAD